MRRQAGGDLAVERRLVLVGIITTAIIITTSVSSSQVRRMQKAEATTTCGGGATTAIPPDALGRRRGVEAAKPGTNHDGIARPQSTTNVFVATIAAVPEEAAVHTRAAVAMTTGLCDAEANDT